MAIVLNAATLVQFALQYGPEIASAIEEATSNDDLATKLEKLGPEAASVLSTIGSQVFPNVAPQLQQIGGALAAFNPNTTKWLQGSLNSYLKLQPPLVVDGQYGAKTTAAVKQVQTQLGLAPDGLAATVTLQALQAALAKFPTV